MARLRGYLIGARKMPKVKQGSNKIRRDKLRAESINKELTRLCLDHGMRGRLPPIRKLIPWSKLKGWNGQAARSLLAACYSDAGKHDEAIDLYRRARREKRGRDDAELMLILAYELCARLERDIANLFCDVPKQADETARDEISTLRASIALLRLDLPALRRHLKRLSVTDGWAKILDKMDQALKR